MFRFLAGRGPLLAELGQLHTQGGRKYRTYCEIVRTNLFQRPDVLKQDPFFLELAIRRRDSKLATSSCL